MTNPGKLDVGIQFLRYGNWPVKEKDRISPPGARGTSKGPRDPRGLRSEHESLYTLRALPGGYEDLPWVSIDIGTALESLREQPGGP